MDYKNIIAEKINTHANLGVENIERLIEIPPKSEMGDYAFPCFQLAKTMKKAPNLIALDLKEQISMEGLERIETTGGYLNFFVDKSTLLKNTIQAALSEDMKYGNSSIGGGKNVCVEFSSPNIAKPFHIGHLYTTVIGNSLYKIFASQGYNAIALNHLGDWGTQFGKLIVAYDRWVDMEHLEKEPIDEFLRIYVKFHEEAEKDKALEDLARQHFKNLEDGCEKETKLWKMMVDLSLNEFKKVYNMLDIHFDYFLGESFYSDKMPAVVDEIEIKGLLTESRGALVVDLDEFNIPPCMIKKSDGATLYATRDLATAIYRKKTFDFYKNVYVVGEAQKLHFKQFFSVLKKMGHDWVKDCIHVPFGLVKFADKKLSTRKGDVVLLEDLLTEAVQRSAAAIETKNPNLEDKENASKKIGLGSVVFAYLKNSRERDIMFNWDDILSFEGETGPYVQYTYARSKSILRKAEEQNFEITPDYSKLTSQDEFELAKLIAIFNETILNALDKYEPSILTRYIVDVAQQFNKFYNLYPIMSCEDAELKSARLNLLKATTIVLRNGLSLLGIDVVEKM